MSWSARFEAPMGANMLRMDIASGGPITAIIGPNGAGKSTLLRVLAGLVQPRSGRITLGDQVLYDASAGIALPPEARRVGYLPQGGSLFPHLSVLDNVAFGLRCRGQSRREARERARASLAELDLEGIVDRRPRRLSGGERQRVALARALVTEPRLLLLDEPLAALDVRVQHTLRHALVARIRASQTPTLWITHDARDVRLADAVIALNDGRVIREGNPQALHDEPGDPFVRALLT